MAGLTSATFNPYKILGINEDASCEEIKAAFRKKSKELHPDQNDSDTSQDFLNVKKAYDILLNKEKRNVFDIYGVVINFHEETVKLAFTIFIQVASQCKKEDLLGAEINDFIKIGLLPKYEDDLRKIKEKIETLKYRLNRIIKKPDEDFITEKGLKVLEEYDKEYKFTLLQKDLHEAALKLLQEYQFDFDRIEESNEITAVTNPLNGKKRNKSRKVGINKGKGRKEDNDN